MTKQIQPQFSSQKPLRRRVQLTCPEASITDPDSFRELSMSSIKRKLEQGIMHNNLTDNAFYSLEPLKYSNLQDALNFHQHVTDRFNALPSEIRKAMGNDLKNFEPYLADPKNKETLQKYGLIKPDAINQNQPSPKTPDPKPPVSDPNAPKGA